MGAKASLVSCFVPTPWPSASAVSGLSNLASVAVFAFAAFGFVAAVLDPAFAFAAFDFLCACEEEEDNEKNCNHGKLAGGA